MNASNVSQSNSYAVPANVWVGVACGTTTALIWALWSIATRHAVTSHLGPGDVTFLRFGVSACILFPILWLNWSKVRSVPIRHLVIMVIGAGAPFMLAASTGVQYAPAAHISTLMIGLMPVFVALLSTFVMRQGLTRKQVRGMAIVLAGILFIGGHALVTNRAAGEWRGDLLFMFAGFLFATFTISQRASGLSPWVATALVNVASAVAFTPAYLLWMEPKLTAAPMSELLTQVGAQGIAVSIFALWLYSEAVRRLGAARAAIIGALTPAFTATLALLILGEIPSLVTVAGIALVMGGVIVVVFGQVPAKPVLSPRA